MQENEAWFQRDDGTCPPFTKMFLENLDEASIQSGRRLNVAAEQKQYMIDAGFVDVEDRIFKVVLFFFLKKESLSTTRTHTMLTSYTLSSSPSAHGTKMPK